MSAQVEVISRVLLAHCHRCGWESEAYDESEDFYAEGRAEADAEAHVCEPESGGESGQGDQEQISSSGTEDRR